MHEAFHSKKTINVKDPAFIKKARELGISPNGYLPYSKSLELVREFQPEDPTNPDGFGNDLRIALIDLLEKRGILEPGQEDNVKFYDSTNTSLDNFHGVDYFIEMTDGKGQIHRATLDLTENAQKLKSGHKADVLFEPLPDAVEEEGAYLSAIERLASKVAHTLTAN